MRSYRPEVWTLMTVLAITGLVLAFGHIAEEVLEGDATKFDQTLLLFFRSVNDVSDPIGPPWVEEMARDITALGSYAVLSVVVCAVTIYLFMAGQRAAAFWILAAVVGGVLLSNVLKLVFERPGRTLCLTQPASSPQASRVVMPPYRPSPISPSALSWRVFMNLSGSSSIS
jgi:undecaprenyl-diphosphatase